MKIAIVANTSWNLYNFRSGIIKTLLSKGTEVIVAAPEDPYAGVLKEWGCHYIPVAIENKGANPFRDVGLLFRFFRIYKKSRPDIILHYTIKPNIYGTLAAAMLGIPVVNNVSGLGTVFLHENIVSFIAKKLYKLAFKYPKKVFFQNQDDLELFVRNKLLAAEQAGLVPGSGVDTEKFIPAVTLKPQSGFTFLMVARLLYDKGIMEYVEAIRILKTRGVKARFQIIGAIDETANLGVSRTTVKKWEEDGLLEYYPFTNNLTDYYHQAHCVVLPSYREGTPRSLLEAGASGIPMITTDVPGCREAVLPGRNGFLCKVKAPEDLAEKMEKMLNLPPEEYAELARGARTYVVENFDEKIVINAYFTAINSILTGRDKL